ncbi:hypothetical protein PGT21_019280 [Puccinia graminis f. sp. tritici]|uniref:Uncharacterized protein n=1 Tax=Puccinia graminis f. sp. tritici TaxID=56615 RepID=A0A5B0MAK3_PUCGR|nr:hypothetical protein PGT21_019280 [Puccinia graminis f. sp. tritici]
MVPITGDWKDRLLGESGSGSGKDKVFYRVDLQLSRVKWYRNTPAVRLKRQPAPIAKWYDSW